MAMAALKTLEERLAQIFHDRPRQLGWGTPLDLRQSLAGIRLAFGHQRGMSHEQRIARSIAAFRLSGEKTAFVYLKYVCMGLNHPADWNLRRLLEDEKALQTVLKQVATLRPDLRRFTACCRGLFASWQKAQAEYAAPDTSPNAPRHPRPSPRPLEMLEQFLRRECPEVFSPNP